MFSNVKIVPTEYFHTISKITDNHLVVEDGIGWKIDWWYRDVAAQWEKGDRLRTETTTKKNRFCIKNIDRKNEAYGSSASISGYHLPYIIEIVPNPDSTIDTLVVLSNHLVFSIPSYVYKKSYWEKYDPVLIEHSESSYFLFNKAKNTGIDAYLQGQLVKVSPSPESKLAATSGQFYHTVKEVTAGGQRLTLEDHSAWKIAKPFRKVANLWLPAEKIRLEHVLDRNRISYVYFINIDRQETIYCDCEMESSNHPVLSLQYPQLEALVDTDPTNGLYIKELNPKPSTPMETLITLNNELTFSVSNYKLTGRDSWNVLAPIILFHAGEKYTLYNLETTRFVTCILLEHDPSQQEAPTELDLDLYGRLEEILNQHVLDQQEAAHALSSALLIHAAELKETNSPIGVFLFLGPTGVGKTELAKALSATLFHSNQALIRIDMSQYSNKWTTAGLIGSGPGYRDSENGGDLTRSLRKQPHSVVLLDEIEKADKEIRLMFLPIFDDAHFKDALGKSVDCKKAIFIMTSNLCASRISELFALGYESSDILKIIEPELMQALSPEFFNRTQPILFRPLKIATIEQLVSRFIDELTIKLKERGIELVIDEGIREYLLKNGYHPALGARPLKRLFENSVVGNVARAIVKQKIPAHSIITLSYAEPEDSWEVTWEPL